jgi:hypothetical protein
MDDWQPPRLDDGISVSLEDIGDVGIARVVRGDRCSIPPFDAEGEFWSSLAPRGQLGWLYFRADDPDHFYVALSLSGSVEEHHAAIRRAAQTLRQRQGGSDAA